MNEYDCSGSATIAPFPTYFPPLGEHVCLFDWWTPFKKTESRRKCIGRDFKSILEARSIILVMAKFCFAVSHHATHQTPTWYALNYIISWEQSNQATPHPDLLGLSSCKRITLPERTKTATSSHFSRCNSRVVRSSVRLLHAARPCTP